MTPNPYVVITEDNSNKFSALSLNDEPVLIDVWILDLGADMCICDDTKGFTEFHSFTMNISVADAKASLHILGGGSVSLRLGGADGELFDLHLKNVAYPPGNRCNLPSLSRLANAGMHGRWQHGAIHLPSPGGFHIGTAKIDNGLYILQLAETKDSQKLRTPMVANVDFDDLVWEKHRRLGHLSLDRMKKLVDQSTGRDVMVQQIKNKLGAIYAICATTRAIVRIPREPAQRKFNGLGNLFHADLGGPYRIKGWVGTKYFCFVTDDAFRFTLALRLQSASAL